MKSSLRRIQSEQKVWCKETFKNHKPYQSILGVIEEVGELAHSHLKMEQGIRGTQEHHIEKAKDAVGDIMIFLIDYCNEMGYDIEKCLEVAWDEVSQRTYEKLQ